MPLACLDIIFRKRDGSILFGYRKISPYRNVWCIVGGRILRNENLAATANRIAKEYGVSFRDLYLVGVFPRVFRNRNDISICVAACGASGKQRIDGNEFSRMVWRKNEPKRLGLHHRVMLSKWKKARKSRKFLTLNRIA
jgi:ADP-ribose pyrophosphatase YjhB (NUDIX family)